MLMVLHLQLNYDFKQSDFEITCIAESHQFAAFERR